MARSGEEVRQDGTSGIRWQRDGDSRRGGRDRCAAADNSSCYRFPFLVRHGPCARTPCNRSHAPSETGGTPATGRAGCRWLRWWRWRTAQTAAQAPPAVVTRRQVGDGESARRPTSNAEWCVKEDDFRGKETKRRTAKNRNRKRATPLTNAIAVVESVLDCRVRCGRGTRLYCHWTDRPDDMVNRPEVIGNVRGMTRLCSWRHDTLTLLLPPGTASMPAPPAAQAMRRALRLLGLLVAGGAALAAADGPGGVGAAAWASYPSLKPCLVWETHFRRRALHRPRSYYATLLLLVH